MTQSHLTFAENHEIPEGYKKTEIGVIPNDWIVENFSKITEVITCGVAATPQYVSEQLGKPFLSASNVKDSRIDFDKHKFIPIKLFEQITKHNKPELGDILYTRVGAGIGDAAVIDKDYEFAIYVSLTLIKLKKNLNSYYVSYLLNSDKYRDLARNGQFAGGGVQNLNVEVVRSFQIPVPNLNEQEKIATALSDTDALISELEKLIEKKQAIKTSTMQQLLTGKTRLPEFALREDGTPKGYKDSELGQIPEDWLIEPLENFTSFISYGFTNPMPTTVNGPYMITAKDINGGKIQYKEARQTSIEAFNTLLTSKSKPKKNDVLLTKDGTLGRLALVEDESICINQSVAVLRPNQRIIPIFFKLLLESSYYQEQMLENAGGSTIKHIYITVVNKMFLALPKSLKEQKKISSILSDIEDSIHKLELKLVKVKAIKVAMMQQLLTGKTRLV